MPEVRVMIPVLKLWRWWQRRRTEWKIRKLVGSRCAFCQHRRRYHTGHRGGCLACGCPTYSINW